MSPVSPVLVFWLSDGYLGLSPVSAVLVIWLSGGYLGLSPGCIVVVIWLSPVCALVVIQTGDRWSQ